MPLWDRITLVWHAVRFHDILTMNSKTEGVRYFCECNKRWHDRKWRPR